ncbi:MAG: serine hydrolase domain-containing protein [Pseudomonadota bacterium]
MDRLTLQAAAHAAFDRLAAAGLPGATLVASDPTATLELALGSVDRAASAPMALPAPMRFASVSKLVIAYVALSLAEDGALDLDAPLQGPQGALPVTLAQCAAHRTGFRDALEDPAFRARAAAADGRIAWREAMEAGLALGRVALAPGERRYANTNALLIAAACERAAGAAFDALAQRRVFAPIGVPLMTALPDSAPKGYRHARAPGALEYGDTLVDASTHIPGWAGPAGGYAGDVRALMRLGTRLAQGDGLSAPARARLHGFEHGGARTWGFLLQRDGAVVGHDGDVPGYAARYGWRPRDGLRVAVLANLSNLVDGTNPAAALADTLFAAQ